MSAKWIRAKKWDDQHLTGWLWPVKILLRTFSGIPLAVVLLTLVTFYGILASVPIGLIALAPTYAVYAVTVVLALAVCTGLPILALGRGLRRSSLAAPARFTILLITTLLLTLATLALWSIVAWPIMRYDPITRSGFRMFGSFVDTYKSVQFRRLPMMEMSELEFYAWWPLRLVLVLFVVNMVTATVRRIEFSFPYIGVLTVHTGIVVIALGSVYYAAQKQEGDMILLAGEVDENGDPRPGPLETGFYDNTDTALWVTQQPEKGWEQRRLFGVPRYNDYNLNALGLKNLPPMAKGDTPDRGALDVRVPPGPHGQGVVDPDVEFRIVGYASHADLISQWMPETEAGSASVGRRGMPIRTIEAYLDLPPDPNDPESADPSKPRKSWRLLPEIPAQRVDLLNVDGTDLLGLEYTRNMPDKRWSDLATSLPAGTEHALIVRHKASGFEAVYPVKTGQRIAVGPTGYVLEVLQLAADPPFPIITRGFQGARSSVAVVHVQPPKPIPSTAAPEPAYQRWIYHRFDEINQDMVDQAADQTGQSAGSGGEPPAMPGRRAATSDLEISYVDASILQIYFDESSEGNVRALVRLPGGAATVTPAVKVGDSVAVSPGLRLKLAERLDNAVMVEFPFSTMSDRRDTRAIGNHQRAAVAVEVSATLQKSESGGGEPWKTKLWVPFTQYARTQTSEAERVVNLPDGRRVRIMFGRVRHEFWPPMGLRLADFEMIPYEHSQLPRDYRSELVVMRRWADRHEDLRRQTSLNEPLLERTPFQPRQDVPGIFNFAARVLSLIAPNQYKFSQAGWDQAGWTESQAATERGEARRPVARFTILGVGNNPGIYIIAAGAVMMSVGIPWAFYVKPWLMRRRKLKIQQQLARGEYPSPDRARPSGETVNGSAASAPPIQNGEVPEGVAAESRS